MFYGRFTRSASRCLMEVRTRLPHSSRASLSDYSRISIRRVECREALVPRNRCSLNRLWGVLSLLRSMSRSLLIS